MTQLRRIGIVAYDDVQALDIVGPADAFSAAMVLAPNRQMFRAYEVALIGFGPKPVRSESGIVFQPDFQDRNTPHLDTLARSSIQRPSDSRARIPFAGHLPDS